MSDASVGYRCRGLEAVTSVQVLVSSKSVTRQARIAGSLPQPARNEPQLRQGRFEQRISQPVDRGAAAVQVATIDGLDREPFGQERVEHGLDRTVEPLVQNEPAIFARHLR